MAYPSNWNLVPVRGRFVGTDGNPIVGKIKFTPMATRLHDAAELVTLIGKTITVTLDNDGAFVANLPATDDPDVTPVDWTYQVQEEFLGGSKYALEVPLASLPTGVHLTLASPASTPGAGQLAVNVGTLTDLRDATTTARDAAVAARVAAEAAVLDAEDAVDLALANHVAGTELGYAQLDSTFSTTNTEVAQALGTIPALTIGPIVGKGRPVLIKFFAPNVYHSVANTEVTFGLTTNGVAFSTLSAFVTTASPHTTKGPWVVLERRLLLAQGQNYTFTINVNGAAAGSSVVVAAGFSPAWLRVVGG